MRGLKGKKAIVTGGAQGIGRSCVEAFLGHGVAVTFGDMEEDVATKTVEELSPKGEIHFVPGDMTEEKTCTDLIAKATELMGGVDFLINNAFSFTAAGPNATREEWHRSVDAGPIAFATMIQHVAPVMKERGGGSIVNIASISAHIAQPGRWTYNASKGAVLQLTRTMAVELGPHGIRVNALCPGYILTPLNQGLHGPTTIAAYVRDYIPLGRVGQPEDVAAAYAFLASDDAAFINGEGLVIDGGQLAM